MHIRKKSRNLSYAPCKYDTVRGIWEKTGLVSQTIYFSSKQQTYFTLQRWSFPFFTAMLLSTAGWILLRCPSASSLRPSWNGSFWRSPWAWRKEKSHTERDQVNREGVPIKQCSSRPGTARVSTHLLLLLFRHTQIFGDYLLNIVPFPVQLNWDHSNSQQLVHTRSAFISVLLVKGLPLIFHVLILLLWTSCSTLRVRDMVRST